MIELAIRYIKGKPYQYGFCSRCGVWIPWEKFNADETHPRCDEYAKNRGVREKAERIALGKGKPLMSRGEYLESRGRDR